MMRAIVSAVIVLSACPAFADEPDIGTIIESHILPGYQALTDETAELAAVAAVECTGNSLELIAAYHDAFDSWLGVSHLRFGPSELNDRGFALAFWPDPRGSTPKALAALIRDEDPAASDPAEFATVSVAARGFYALEFLLFDPQFAAGENPDYRCTLVQAVTTDIASNAAAIQTGWQSGYADLMSKPGNDTYRSSTEAAQQVFTALLTGLEFTSDTRLGRPMGTFKRPRPSRAEARRSGRSLRHVILSLAATRQLTARISMDDTQVDAAFGIAIRRAAQLDDPIFAGVATPLGRLRVEVLQQNIDSIRQLLTEQVGPSLGIAAGFNSLDGD